jgi:hypothetical protein
MKLKKNHKNNLKEIQNNKKYEDHNWNNTKA